MKYKIKNSLHIELDKNGLINYAILNPALRRDKERKLFLESNDNNYNSNNNIIKRKNNNENLFNTLTHLSDLNDTDDKIYKNMVKKVKIDSNDDDLLNNSIGNNTYVTEEKNEIIKSNHKLDNLNRLIKFEEYVTNSADNTIGIKMKNKIINDIKNDNEICSTNDVNNNLAISLYSSIIAISETAKNQIAKEEDILEGLINDYLQIRYKGLLEKVSYIYIIYYTIIYLNIIIFLYFVI